jgi:glycosyltransferase
MKFSLITTSYNSAATIRDTIESVLSQDYAGIEYIVVDGGSTDRTVEIIREYGPRITKWISEPDSGIYNAMNKGIALATGDVVGTINSDDFYASKDVLRRVATTMSQPNIDCVFGDLDYVDPGNVSRVVRRWRSRPYRDGAFRNGWHPPHPTFFVRRSVIQRHGAFNETLRISSDYELMLRYLEVAKIGSAYIPGVMVKMRDGGISNRSLSNVVKANWECYQSFRLNHLRITPLVMLRKPMSKLVQLLYARTMSDATDASETRQAQGNWPLV